jgi:uncharacterized protein YabN with tetrapyrrole methylase and pyrophosphatase domain
LGLGEKCRLDPKLGIHITGFTQWVKLLRAKYKLLDKVVNLEKDAAEFGFRWEDACQIMAQIHSECAEIQEHLDTGITLHNRADLQEEIGDLLHVVFSLCFLPI